VINGAFVNSVDGGLAQDMQQGWLLVIRAVSWKRTSET